MDIIKGLTEKQQTSLLQGVKNVCRIFWGPDGDLSRELMQGGYFRFLKELEPLHRELPDLYSVSQTFLNGFSNARDLLESLERTYVLLFINRRGGVKTPLYHSCYVSDGAPLMGPPARMMTERLRAAGLNLADHLNEPPDHLAIEGEYLFFLLEKGWKQNVVWMLEEAGIFAGETMLPWTLMLKERLEGDPDVGFYGRSMKIFCVLLQIISTH